MKNWLGVDLGTSGMKALVVDDDGGVVARASAEYATESSANLHEQDPTEYLSALGRVFRDLGVADIAGIAIVGQTPTLVLADETGRPVRRAITWRDNRATTEAAFFREHFASSHETFGVDNLWDVSQLPAKILWLSTHEPESLARARWLLQPKDYLGFAITGTVGSDAWSSKGIVAIDGRGAATQVLAAAGVDDTVVPPLREPWEMLGLTGGAHAREHGIPEGIPVGVGWTDALGGMLGIGAIVEPRSFVLTGTSDIVGTSRLAEGPPIDGLYRVPKSVNPLPIDYGPTQSSGASMIWLSRLLGKSVSELIGEAQDARDTAATFVPYLRGERAPIWNQNVRAGITGLSEDDGPAEIALAVMRGVALSGRHVLESAWSGTDASREVHLGGANVTRLGWIRARRDALPAGLVIHREPQLPALGAAMLARTAASGDVLGESYERLKSDALHLSAEQADLAASRSRFAEYERAVAQAIDSAARQP